METVTHSSPERGGGPFGAAEWWRGPRHKRVAQLWAPSTTPLRVAVPLPVPGKI
jgi:hypothetical protein